MKRAEEARWRLDPGEVRWTEMGTSSSGRAKVRLSRSLDDRSTQLTGEHIATGLSVTGTIPQGRYSRDEMRRLRDQLRTRLFDELQTRVARHLRIPGR